MQNTSWLETLATMTDYEVGFNDLLKSQSDCIQKAYQGNDQETLKILIGGSDRLACKTTIFQS